ncbi:MULTISPECIES: cell wall-active antibiotics response protein LiaF [Brevibacillus]|uniref:cell wall-active antibiotics response protein LiaF n=1 Tax=Brevibacillus TaxID=55080 RepID=UPI00039C5E1F|nr:cell wall-active antibiotics response protein LiaF [Brevibacillus borstelensis]KKX53403.1 membrane protein [Brevibacillus borstelensis cifa_chp40]MCC0565922.1 cell wall-active antibiotics response protein LiaF [Brevibacillus borstelensis]MCM3471678.1 cell wall-active antibiotics response protein LiaF [Brevibacillus borstelensis]MCM3557953.1 cell wall-active antibiotics response protein LiaF [Brevibacillus borstelensis]MCM3591571.1 cell wall-active antibiotics response protein LiaF [Brevibac
MKLSRLQKMTVGVLIILTGIGLFLDSLHIITFGLFDLWPMVLVYFGVQMWGNHKRVRGGLLAGLGIMIALDMWLHIGMDDLFQLVIPLLFIYFGFRLIRGRSADKGIRPTIPEAAEAADADPNFASAEDTATGKQSGHWRQKAGYRNPFGTERSRWTASSAGPGSILSPKDSRSSLIGDFHLTSGRFELSQLHIWHGVGNVVIDLSRAMLMDDEAFLIVDGWVGDVTIYVPVDMPVAVSAEVRIGDLEVFGHRQGGINRSVMIRSEQYEQEAQKIHVQISLLVGDVKVKYI